MFTGIIEKTTPLQAIKGDRFVFAKPSAWRLREGQSISIDGVCSTVLRSNSKNFTVQYIPETLRVIKPLVVGRKMNLERSIRSSDRFEGHFVLGHVDTVGIVSSISSHVLKINYPKKFKKFLAYKGSVAINGVSLTTLRGLVVALIHHTLTHTNLGELKKGDKVNIEFDVLAKYK